MRRRSSAIGTLSLLSLSCVAVWSASGCSSEPTAPLDSSAAGSVAAGRGGSAGTAAVGGASAGRGVGGSVQGGAGAGSVAGSGGTAGGTSVGGAGGVGGGTGGSVSVGGAGGSSATGGSGGLGAMGGADASGGAGNTGSGGQGTGGVGVGGAAGAGGTSGGAGSSGAAGMGAGGMGPPPSMLTEGTCKTDLGGYNNNGSVTYYTFAMGTSLVHCSYGTHPGNPDKVDYANTNSGQYFAAINTSDYSTAAKCGACIEVTRDGNRKVTVTVVDECPIGSNPKCKPGHLDLSQAAFSQIGSPGSEGYLGTGNGGDTGTISWKYVPCPMNGKVHLRLKEPSNENWNEVLVENTLYAVNKVEAYVNGAWVNASRTADNYWLPPDGKFGNPPFRIRVTDINGTVLEDTIDRVAGDIETDFQMTCH